MIYCFVNIIQGIMATVTLRSVEDLFGERFYVPAYQRGYRWDETQVKELLEDLFSFSRKEEDREYCLQPVIVKKRDDLSWELVDGQQRLTALWLIFSLYYCSNREDYEDLEFKKYDLEYEEKPDFTGLFSHITEMIKTTGYANLGKELEKEIGKSIDAKHLIESIKFIVSFKIDNVLSRGILNRIMEVLSRVQVIWYVLDEQDDPIQTFTNVNANKIALTDSELIKAVLLNYSDENDMTNRALQWEEIEKGLNNESLWGFVAQNDKVTYSTRIDYLFEIICAREKWFNEYNDRYRVYRAIIKHLTSKNDASELWRKVQETYDILRDWYENYFFYHIIGLLMIVTRLKGTELINQLYTQYTKSSKTDFKKFIVKELKETYISDDNKTPFTKLDKTKMADEIEKIKYDNTDAVKAVLLLYNIAMLVIADNEYERFPFDLYKANTWDIEHINPQTPKEASDEEKRKWLESYQRIIDNKDLQDRIEYYLQSNSASTLENFELIVESINKLFSFGDNDYIGNLVLLDSSTNSSYKNACFSDKRRIIISKERANHEKDIEKKDEEKKKPENKKKYIPIGTKWVFLKGYETAEELKVWGQSDMNDYVADIVEKTYVVLGGK